MTWRDAANAVTWLRKKATRLTREILRRVVAGSPDPERHCVDIRPLNACGVDVRHWRDGLELSVAAALRDLQDANAGRAAGAHVRSR